MCPGNNLIRLNGQADHIFPNVSFLKLWLIYTCACITVNIFIWRQQTLAVYMYMSGPFGGFSISENKKKKKKKTEKKPQTICDF